MKILYLSCHSVLEYQEVKLFTELGHDVFSMGVYTGSNQGTLRGPIPNLYQDEQLKTIALQGAKENIPQELIDWMDICVSMHNASLPGEDHPQPWIKNNWDKFKKSKKPIIWRSIGQSTGNVEQALEKFRKDGLRIVRYSPKEDQIPHYQGSDAMIRFYTDPVEFDGYVGDIARVVNISQALFGGDGVPSRGDHMNLKEFKQAVEGLDWKVFGPNNQKALQHDGGVLPYEDMKSMLRFNRVYLYVGTRPASYTLGFMEAMMTGIPIVSIGNALGNSVYTDQKTFEVPEILGPNGIAGFHTDSPFELNQYLKQLIDDQDLARKIGEQGRMRAIQFFAKDLIASQWKEFFKTLL